MKLGIIPRADSGIAGKPFESEDKRFAPRPKLAKAFRHGTRFVLSARRIGKNAKSFDFPAYTRKLKPVKYPKENADYLSVFSVTPSVIFSLM
jgi:hypothetical protein